MKVLVSEKLSKHKLKTPEGYLICTDAILARTGKQIYQKNELFADSNDYSEVEVDRPFDEVFNEKTLASFENKPITVEHPDEEVNVNNHSTYAVGYVRDVRKGTYEGQDVMLGNLVITDKQTIKEIENGEHTDLSCGYECDIQDSNNGYRQCNIRGNHVALCQQGRAGIAHIVDSKAENDKIKNLKINDDIENAEKVVEYLEDNISNYVNMCLSTLRKKYDVQTGTAYHTSKVDYGYYCVAKIYALTPKLKLNYMFMDGINYEIKYYVKKIDSLLNKYVNMKIQDKKGNIYICKNPISEITISTSRIEFNIIVKFVKTDVKDDANKIKECCKKQNSCKDFIDDYSKINDATSIKKIVAEVKKAADKWIIDSFGNIDDFDIDLKVSTKKKIDRNNTAHVIIVSAELGYSSFDELRRLLNKIVQKYDKNAYFDMECPGRAECYIWSNKVTDSINDMAVWQLKPETNLNKLSIAITNNDIAALNAMLNIVNKDIDDYNNNYHRLSNSDKLTLNKKFGKLVEKMNHLGVKTHVLKLDSKKMTMSDVVKILNVIDVYKKAKDTYYVNSKEHEI